MTLRPLLLTLTASLLALPALGATQQLAVDSEASQVTFFLKATGHDVHGTLYLQDGRLEVDPETGTVSGQLTIDATRAESGNAKRDKTMRKKVLESESHPLIVFKPQTFSGELPASGTSEIELHGMVEIVGSEHPLDLTASFTADGDSWTAEATFPVPYVEWGLHDPSLFLLKVAKTVEVSISATGTLATAPAVAALAD